MQNLVSMETVRVISCQTFEEELLYGRSAFIIKVLLFVITWLSRARLSPEVTARVASMMRTREEPEIVLELFIEVAFIQDHPIGSLVGRASCYWTVSKALGLFINSHQTLDVGVF